MNALARKLREQFPEPNARKMGAKLTSMCDLLDRWYGRDELFARKGGQPPLTGSCLLAIVPPLESTATFGSSCATAQTLIICSNNKKLTMTTGVRSFPPFRRVCRYAATGNPDVIRKGRVADDPPRTSSSYFNFRLPQGGLRTLRIEHQLCRDLIGARLGGKFVVP